MRDECGSLRRRTSRRLLGRGRCARIWSPLRSWFSAGNAILLNGAFHSANREIGVPGVGTAPRPFFGRGNQVGFHWFEVNVLDSPLDLGFDAALSDHVSPVPRVRARLTAVYPLRN